MPTLFMSYKRGTASIVPLMERLRAAKYRVWFDKDDIHAGEDWQASIDRGLRLADGVVVGLTPAACESPYVQYEVQQAVTLGKPIFPTKLEAFDPSRETELLQRLQLEKIQYVDFTTAGSDVWSKGTERLLADLALKNLKVTRHEQRQTRGELTYALHQRYLQRLVDRIGKLPLSQIRADQPDGVPLEAVFVDSPTGLSISVEVQDWHVVDWWLSRVGEQTQNENSPRLRPADLKYEQAALESLIEQVDRRIDDYRQKNPNEEPDYRFNTWKNGPHKNVVTLAVQDVAAARDRLVILGGPGTGKSTFVKHLALCLAGEQLEGWQRAARLGQLRQWPHGRLTPVYVELRRLVASPHYPSTLQQQPDEGHLWQYIRHEVLGDELAAFADELHMDLEQGHAVLILDGLDEVPYPEGQLGLRQRQLRSLAASLNDHYAQSRILVASRPHAYEGWTLPGFEALEIADFEDYHRVELASRLYAVSGLSEDEAQAKANKLNEALQPVDHELKNRPLFLTLMATIFLENAADSLPTRKGALYQRSISLLLERWTQAKPDAPTLPSLLGTASTEELVARLATLAFEVHRDFGDQPGTPEIPVDRLYVHLCKIARRTGADPMGLFTYLSENAGILVSPGQDAERDVFHFAHRSFQEYLAAQDLTRQCQAAGDFAPLRHLIQTKPDLWREPCKLVGDVLVEQERERELWDLVDDLLDDDLPDALSADDPRWWGVWLAGQVALEQGLHQAPNLRKGEREVKRSLVEWLVGLISTPQALRVGERVESGKMLAWLGDPRPGVGVKNGLPDFDWVQLPGGTFELGGDQDAWQSLKAMQVKLDTFAIARYPVTSAQYQAFVDAPDGYQNASWWSYSQEATAWHEKNPQPQDAAWQIPNHPREIVTWYEAVAFCRWASAKLGYEIRLPTELEWERAARGNDKRLFAYGNDFDATKANGYETGIGQTSAVGIFPQGATPEGLCDLSGNVWEWTLTDFEDINNNNIEGNRRRVLRGGAWDFNAQFSRAASRDVRNPSFGNFDLGFRVLCVPPSL